MKKDINRILSQDIINIPENLHVFEGHFEGHPIVPGIYSIEIALLYLKRLWQKQVWLQKIEKCKFNKPILPTSQLQICIKKIVSENDVHKVKIIFVDSEKSAVVDMSLVVHSHE